MRRTSANYEQELLRQTGNDGARRLETAEKLLGDLPGLRLARAENDYQVNLKAEIEIQHLNLKIDQLLQHQWQRLLELQCLQLEVLNELELGRSGGRKP